MTRPIYITLDGRDLAVDLADSEVYEGSERLAGLWPVRDADVCRAALAAAEHAEAERAADEAADRAFTEGEEADALTAYAAEHVRRGVWGDWRAEASSDANVRAARPGARWPQGHPRDAARAHAGDGSGNGCQVRDRHALVAFFEKVSGRPAESDDHRR